MDNQIFPLLENMLSVTARRQQALSSNIANMDTPGYKALDVAFQQELSASMQDVHGARPSDDAGNRIVGGAVR
jgi:flagellar basal-body rod protein FlgB